MNGSVWHRRPALAVLAAAASLAVALPQPPAPAATSASLDAGLSAQLHLAMDARRQAYGREPLFARTAYLSTAQSMALRLANGGSVAEPADGTPATWISWSVPSYSLQTDAREAIAEVVQALDAVLRYELHTDGGWAVAVRDLGVGSLALAVVGLVGWPDPGIGSNTGCSGAGYCWSARGVNPHLPWTRNRIAIHLSTAGLPAAGESLLRAAIGRIDAVPGLGADLVYAGRTSATSPGPGRRFLVKWAAGSACGSAVLACTLTDTQGSYKLVFGATITVISARYAADPGTERWTGTLTHELGHLLGLGHYGSAYGGSYQLMRSAGGPTTPRSGDVNGLRTLDRPGRLSVGLRSAASWFRTGQQARMTVATSSTGLGGVRSVAIQCHDRYGRLQTPVRRTGVWDIRRREHTFSWTVGAGQSYATSCRAVGTSKAGSGASTWIRVSFAG